MGTDCWTAGPEPAGAPPYVELKKGGDPCLVRVPCPAWHGQAIAGEASKPNRLI